MNSGIAYKKYLALRNILHSYKIYKGGLLSPLEKEIRLIKDKITSEEYTRITKAFEDYEEYMLNIIANTRRVFIKLENGKEIQDANFDDLSNVFADLDD